MYIGLVRCHMSAGENLDNLLCNKNMVNTKQLMGFLSVGLLLFSLMASCRIVGLTDDYSRLSPADKKLVGYSSRRDTTNKLILMLHGREMRERLDPNQMNVVYYYNPYCKGDRCVPLSTVQKLVGDKARLYVVTRILAPHVLKQASEYRIYGMDKYYYKSKYLFKYEDRFIDELTGNTTASQDSLNLYLFRGRDFLKTISPLSDSLELPTLVQEVR